MIDIKKNFNTFKMLVPCCCVTVILCVTVFFSSAAAGAPDWYEADDIIREDSYNWYFRGSGSSSESPDDAMRRAQANALAGIAERIGVSDPAKKAYVIARIKGWTIHMSEDRRVRRQYHVWLIVRCPKSELGRLHDHVNGGQARLEQAFQEFQNHHYDKAATIAESLAAEYPLGGQPVFQTERALLLASDAYAALGSPRRALEACRSVLAGSRESKYREEAAARKQAILADYENLVFRGGFSGKTILVQSTVNLDASSLQEWTRMQKEMENLVTSAGGKLVGPGSPLHARLNGVDMLPNDAAASEMLAESGADGLLRVMASGRINRRENKENPLTGEDYQFFGDTVFQLRLAGREPYTWKRSGMTGWNPVSPSMCMDVLALNLLTAWKPDLAKYLEGP